MEFTILQFAGAASAVSFLLFLLYLVGGLKAQRPHYFMKAGIFLLLSIGAAVYVGSSLGQAQQQERAYLGSLQTGADHYQALFHEAPASCMDVKQGTTYPVAFRERCMWLQFSTCTEALQAFVARYPYRMRIAKDTDLMFEMAAIEKLPDWWNPQALGDSVYMFTYEQEEPSLIRKAFVSMDSTEVYFYEVIY